MQWLRSRRDVCEQTCDSGQHRHAGALSSSPPRKEELLCRLHADARRSGACMHLCCTIILLAVELDAGLDASMVVFITLDARVGKCSKLVNVGRSLKHDSTQHARTNPS